MNPFHEREVDHHAAIDGRATRHIVTAAANGHLEAQPAREIDCIDYIGHATAPGNQGRPLVDQPIVDPSCLVIAGVRGFQQLAGECRRKRGDSIGNG